MQMPMRSLRRTPSIMRASWSEVPAEHGALASGGFEQYHHVAADATLKELVHRLHLAGDASVLAATHMRAGVRHEVGNAECRAALQLVGEGGDRLLPVGVVGAGEIDQVRVVNDHRANAGTFGLGLIKGDVGVGVGLGLPLALVLGEDLHRLDADRGAAGERLADAARDGHVCAKGHETTSNNPYDADYSTGGARESYTRWVLRFGR